MLEFFQNIFQKRKSVPESIQWLQSKGVRSLEDKEFWTYLSHPEKAPTNAGFDFKDARTRLEVIYSNGDKITDTIPENAHVFTHDEFQNYLLPGSVLHFVHTDACIQRYQKSKLCYLHAVTMVQYYAICFYCQKHNLPIQHSVLNIGFYIKENFDSDRLRKHILDNKGGTSFLELKAILQPDSKFAHVYFDTDDDVVPTIVSNLKKYGPCLVSNFLVTTDFCDKKVHRHCGSLDKDSKGSGHAMVMVGYKYDEGKHWFLLQNWWLEKQFVEMDIEYLASCSPSLHWVTTEQTEIPEGKPTNFGIWLETEAAEFLDGYELEDLFQ